MSILKSIILVLVTVVNANVFADESVAKAFQETFIPHILTKPPNKLAKVKYQNVEINLGNLVNSVQVASEPFISWEAEPEKYYTLIMVGDIHPALTRSALPIVGKLGGVQHWLVVNIPSNHLNKGEVLSAYLPPLPPPGLGQYHYVFLIYEQRSKQTFNEPVIRGITTLNRIPFSLEKIVRKYNFSDPLAGNFFMASLLNLNIGK